MGGVLRHWNLSYGRAGGVVLLRSRLLGVTVVLAQSTLRQPGHTSIQKLRGQSGCGGCGGSGAVLPALVDEELDPNALAPDAEESPINCRQRRTTCARLEPNLAKWRAPSDTPGAMVVRALAETPRAPTIFLALSQMMQETIYKQSTKWRFPHRGITCTRPDPLIELVSLTLQPHDPGVRLILSLPRGQSPARTPSPHTAGAGR